MLPSRSLSNTMIDRLLVGDGPSGGSEEIDISIIGVTYISIIGVTYLHFTVGRCINHTRH